MCVVEDSMEGPEGIEAAWRFVSFALRYGAGCAVHLSNLDPKELKTSKDLLLVDLLVLVRFTPLLMRFFDAVESIRTVL